MLYISDKYQRLPDVNLIGDRTEVVEIMVKRLKQYTEANDLRRKWRGFGDDIELFEEEMEVVRSEINKILGKGIPRDLIEINERVSCLRRRIDGSQGYISYLKHKELNKIREIKVPGGWHKSNK